MAASGNIAFKIAVKQLQMETWLCYWPPIGTRHRPIQHRRPLTMYDLATIHALQTTTDRRQTTHCTQGST